MQQNNFNGAYFQPNLPNGHSEEMANLQQNDEKRKEKERIFWNRNKSKK